MTYEQTISVLHLAPRVNDVLKKWLKWKWKRELFDLYYYPWNTTKIYSIDKKSKEDFATSAPPSRFGKLKWWFLLLLSGGVIAFIFIVFGQVGDLLEN